MDSRHLLLQLVVLAAAVAASSAMPEAIQLPGTVPADPAVNDRPVIGIVTHPGDGTYEMRTYGAGEGASYIAASYVKLVEAGGARVVPLIYDEPEERLREKLCLVNGVMITEEWPIF